jgi:L-lactate dehydrogenase complex protein LldG
MSTATDSRQRILAGIRKATTSTASSAEQRATAYAALPRPYVHAGKRSRKQTLDLLVERLREYDAGVAETTPAGLVAAIAEQLAASGRHNFVVPPALPAEWLVPGYQFTADNGLAQDVIEKMDGVVTEAFCAVADSGTIVLHHSATEGRRILSLLPDFHLCILRSSQVVETLPEYFSRCVQPPALATTISGPSATADIEMTRIKGVHGPRFLQVILVHDEETN